MNSIEPLATPPAGKAQPIGAIDVSEPLLDDAAVRAATIGAEAQNLDPQTITLDEFAQGKATPNPQAVPPQPPPVEVPAKFLKTNGEVDVEKIQASTKALEQGIQQKQEAISKSVDDYMREYQERETQFRNLPNPNKLARPAQPLPEAQVQQVDTGNYEDVIRRDYAADPLGTTTRLLDLMLQDRLRPIEEEKKTESTRKNLQQLAEKDPRILREDVFAKVNEKLRTDPHLLTLKNPHRAAWLEVKDEMQLGELQAPAQPSTRILSPVLGGGTPPSAPLSSVPSQRNVAADLASLDSLDLRDKAQEAAGDEAIRRALMGLRG